MKFSWLGRRAGAFAVAGFAVLVTVGWAARRASTQAERPIEPGEVDKFASNIGEFSYFPGAGEVSLATRDGLSRLGIELSLVVDGVERGLVLREARARHATNSLELSFPIDTIGGGREVVDATASSSEPSRISAKLSLRLDPQSDRLDLAVDLEDPPLSAPPTFELRLAFDAGARTIFAPGVGPISDLGKVEAKAVVAEDDTHAFAIAGSGSLPGIAERPPDVEGVGNQPRTIVSVPAVRPPPNPPEPATSRMQVSLLVGATAQSIWGNVYASLGVDTAKVSGIVTGASARPVVVAVRDDGRPEARFSTDAQGRFEVMVPKRATTWYATLDGTASSLPVRYVPGGQRPLSLDISPGGELRIKVVDGDTSAPLLSRLLVKGIEGTVDPSFGPDFRASGAGPLMDTLDGTATTPLPVGKYRVSATHGIEWSVDAAEVLIESGRTTSVDLELRHVVATPGLVACDLHVHARPSFDSPVTVEDRVLSLASAGIDFAVPSEHNIVGDYSEASEVLGLGSSFAHVTGIEITTYSPRFGHFGIFPYPKTARVPPFRGTTAARLFAFAHRGDPKRIVQVNHPRLEGGIGYFAAAGFDSKKQRWPGSIAPDFDTIEVYNGYEAADRPRVERVMRDWFAILNQGRRYPATGSSDSHRIQYQWAGYPRTFAMVPSNDAGDTGRAIDTDAVVEALKRGRSFVSSGPIVDFEVIPEAAPAVPRGPGEVLRWSKGQLRAHVRVRAAPWIDVTSVEVLAGIPDRGRARLGGSASGAPSGITHTAFLAALPRREAKLGKEKGTLREVEERTVRYDEDVTLDVPEEARWVVLVVRGERAMDDVLPFMHIQPLAFTNPVWLEP